MQSAEVVVAGSDQGEPVGNSGMQREQFGKLELRASRSDWAEGPADFERRLRFHVKEVQVAGAAVVVDQDYGAGPGARALAGEGVSCRQGGKRKACRCAGAQFQEPAAAQVPSLRGVFFTGHCLRFPAELPGSYKVTNPASGVVSLARHPEGSVTFTC